MKKIILLIFAILSFSSLFFKPVVSQYNGRVLVLKGNVFIDNNRNTILDSGESGYGNVLITPLDNAVDFQGNLLTPKYTDQNGNFFWDGLMERTNYRFNYSNPYGYLFENYDISLRCHPGKSCVRAADPVEGFRADTVVENIMGFEVPLIPEPVSAASSSLILQISIDLGPLPSPPPTTATSGEYSTASSSTQYGGNAVSVGISGMAFIDSNGDGLLNGGEVNNGVQGLTVYIQPGQSGANGYPISQPVISKLGGIWSIGNLKSNSPYSLTFYNPRDYEFGNLNDDNVCRDCVHTPTQAEKPIEAVYVQTLPTYNIPLVYKPGTPGGSQNATFPTFVTIFGSLTGSPTTGGAPTKPPTSGVPQFGVAVYGSFFLDSDNDGVQDANEPPISGGTAELSENGDMSPYGFSRYPIKPNPSISQSNGIYGFDDLIPGRSYQMRIYNPAGYAFGNIIPDYSCNNCVQRTTASSGLKSKYIYTLPAWAVPLVSFNGIAAGEQYIDILVDCPPNIEPPVTPTPSQTPTQSPTQTPKPNYTGTALVGNIYVDKNGNGKKDGNDNWYSGVTVTLYDKNKNPARDAGGNLIQSSKTDANGRFVFEYTLPGEYYIKLSGIADAWDPGFIGPFVTNTGSDTTANDRVNSKYIVNLGDYGLTPKGNASCGGQVYDDVDYDDRYTSKDKPHSGIKINIYSPVYGFLIQTVVSGADGKWSCPGLSNNITYRCEFLNGQLTSTGQYPTRFVTGGEYGVDMGLSPPINNNNQDNANRPTEFITTCFVVGARDLPQSGFYDTVVSFTANATGRAYDSTGSQFATKLVKNYQSGSLYGITYRPESGDTYASAFFKVGTDYGPGGSGAVYKISPDKTFSLYVDLNELFGFEYAGSNKTFPTFSVADLEQAPKYALKTSLGDLQSNNRYLFVTNLYNNEVVQIPITATPNAQNTFRMAVPDPGCGVVGDWRIFAVNLFQNELYVGGVCSGEGGSAIAAYVQRFNNANRQWTLVFSMPLTYARGCSTSNKCEVTRWAKWSPNANNEYSQAQVGAIHFDDNGRMIIGLKDKSTDGIRAKISAPDMLIACPNANGIFTLESKGVCGGRTGAMPVMRSIWNTKRLYGPGGGHYFNVKSLNYHDYGVAYGITKAGPQQIIATGFDMTNSSEGGVSWFNTDTGGLIKSYGIYRTTEQATYTFGKANGLGSITPKFPPSLDVIECGRVWYDCNGNGIQDCNEKGIANIKVFLFYQDNPNCPIAWALTDANGYFKFVVLPGKKYACKIDSQEIQTKFGDFNLSPALNDPALEAIDSDAVMVNGLLVANHTSSVISGLDINHCHFGIIKPSTYPSQGGYGHWGPQKKQ